MIECPWCKKPIRFWQKKTDYLTSYDIKTHKEETEKMHRLCGLERKGTECFGHFTKAPGWEHIRK
jgi:hypothetical protein